MLYERKDIDQLEKKGAILKEEIEKSAKVKAIQDEYASKGFTSKIASMPKKFSNSFLKKDANFESGSQSTLGELKAEFEALKPPPRNPVFVLDLVKDGLLNIDQFIDVNNTIICYFSKASLL